MQLEAARKILAEYEITVGKAENDEREVLVRMLIRSKALGNIVTGFWASADLPGFVEDFVRHAESFTPKAFARLWVNSENARESGADLEMLEDEGQKIKEKQMGIAERLKAALDI